MNDLNNKAKQSVLEDLINMMKEKEAEDFKGKSSKFASNKMDTVNHLKEMKEMGEHGPDRFLGDKQDKIHEHDEMMSGHEGEDEDDEDLEKLKEMYSRIK